MDGYDQRVLSRASQVNSIDELVLDRAGESLRDKTAGLPVDSFARGTSLRSLIRRGVGRNARQRVKSTARQAAPGPSLEDLKRQRQDLRKRWVELQKPDARVGLSGPNQNWGRQRSAEDASMALDRLEDQIKRMEQRAPSPPGIPFGKAAAATGSYDQRVLSRAAQTVSGRSVPFEKSALLVAPDLLQAHYQTLPDGSYVDLGIASRPSAIRKAYPDIPPENIKDIHGVPVYMAPVDEEVARGEIRRDRNAARVGYGLTGLTLGGGLGALLGNVKFKSPAIGAVAGGLGGAGLGALAGHLLSNPRLSAETLERFRELPTLEEEGSEPVKVASVLGSPDSERHVTHMLKLSAAKLAAGTILHMYKTTPKGRNIYDYGLGDTPEDVLEAYPDLSLEDLKYVDGNPGFRRRVTGDEKEKARRNLSRGRLHAGAMGIPLGAALGGMGGFGIYKLRRRGASVKDLLRTSKPQIIRALKRGALAGAGLGGIGMFLLARNTQKDSDRYQRLFRGLPDWVEE